MDISFDKDFDHNRVQFTALFVHQESYIELLKKCNFNFGLHLFDKNKRELPIVQSAYMKISNGLKKINLIGKNAKLTITEIMYSKPLSIIVCKVKLKKNFTILPIPYIILASRPNFPDKMIYGVLDKTHENMGQFYTIPLEEPYIIHGKIGVMFKSYDSENENEMEIINNIRTRKIYIKNPIEKSNVNFRLSKINNEVNEGNEGNENNRIYRSNEGNENNRMYRSNEDNRGYRSNEVPDEIRKKYFMEKEEKIKSKLKNKHDIDAHVSIVKGTVRPEVSEAVERLPYRNSDIKKNENSHETFEGCVVQKGKRGGKYIIKSNGKKKYITGLSSGRGGGKIVYKVRLDSV